MCGGEGSRLEGEAEKPLFEVGGRPMLARVLDALDAATVETVYAVASPDAPETMAYLAGRPARLIEGSGEGYVADIGRGIEVVGPPVLTVVADLPLLAADLIDRAVGAYDSRNVPVCVPTRLKEALDVSADTVRDVAGRRLSPTGLNVVAAGDSPGERVERVWDARAAVNVNYASDAAVAEVLAG